MLGNNLLIIDTLNLCFRFKHTLYKADEVVAPEWATLDDMVEVMREELADSYFLESFVNTITSLAASYKAKNIICAADLGSSTWRKEIYPEYKADRAEKYAKQSIAEQAIGIVFMEHYKQLLEDLEGQGYLVLAEYGIEADDIAAALVMECASDYTHTWLVSSDTDWNLLVSDTVSQFNWATKSTWKNVQKTGPRPKEVTISNWEEHHICTRDQYLDLKALIADEDNIKGISGIGPKRGLSLINKYGTLENLVSALPIKNSKAAYILELNSRADTLLLNKKLMDIITYNKEIIGDYIKVIRNRIL